MKTKREELLEEVIANARRDRRRLEAVADSLLTKFDEHSEAVQEDGGDLAVDPDTAAAFSEEISKISDSLTKINQQLVEVIKSEKKSDKPTAEKLSKEEVEDAYEEIQPQEVN